MTNQELNCASCGAPIPVPENREFINCPYCAAILAIIRGEGYTAFKMVESVTKALPTLEELTRKTGQLPPLPAQKEEEEPQSESDKISEQIQLAEMQLANLQAEIVSLERNQQANRNTKPLRRLYTQKFQILEGLRTSNQALAALGPQDYGSRISALEAEVDWLNAELQALESASEGENLDASNVWETTIDRIREYRRKVLIKIGDLQMETIKAQLASFQLKEVKLHDQAAVEATLAVIRADQDKIARMPQTVEVSMVKDELTARYQALLKALAALKRQAEAAQVKPLMIPVSSGDNSNNGKPESGGLFSALRRKK